MSNIYLTTRRGNIDSLTIYHYEFVDWIKNDSSKRKKLSKWLLSVSGFSIHKITNTEFTTYLKLDEGHTPQYNYSGSSKQLPPFENTQKLSHLISGFLSVNLKQHYKRFLNTNTYIVKEVQIAPFKLLKAFEYNVEVFETGKYYIHFNPQTKIVSGGETITIDFVNELKKNIPSKEDSLIFNLVNIFSKRRTKIDITSVDDRTKIDELVNENNYIGTFDYKFLSTFSVDIFRNVISNTSKNLNESIHFLNPILQKIELPEFLNLNEDKYLTSTPLEFDKIKNLRVGCKTEKITIYSQSEFNNQNQIEFTRDISPDEILTANISRDIHFNTPIEITATVKKYNDTYYLNNFNQTEGIYTVVNPQSAVHFNGIFKSPKNKCILPLVIGDYNLEIFNEIFFSLSTQDNNLHILTPIIMKENDEIDIDEVQERLKLIKTQTLLTIFVKHKMPDDYFIRLNKIPKVKYQIFKGSFQKATLSNFVCKCLEKLGGIITTIHETYIHENGYFIGMDLGHYTISDEKFSNLALVLFDKNGILIDKCVIPKIPLAENIEVKYFAEAIYILANSLQRKKLPAPLQIVLHRDGKLHKNDTTIISSVISEIWGKIKLDIVEIIKSGFPLVVQKVDSKNCKIPESGSAYVDELHKYAILITNTQVVEENVAVNPIIVKQKYGDTDFRLIVSQVFWFTKVYTNNLYYPTRLPATTLKANNIAGTSTKIHRQSYLG